jgi:hypothetical protein
MTRPTCSRASEGATAAAYPYAIRRTRGHRNAGATVSGKLAFDLYRWLGANRKLPWGRSWAKNLARNW